MIWKVLLAAFVLHVLGAALVLRLQARRVCNWRIPIGPAVGGQLATSLVGLIAGLACVVAAGEMGMRASSWGLYALGVMAATVAWGLALKRLVAWMAQRAKGAFYSPMTMRRISARSFFYVLACYGCALLLAFGAWRALHLPSTGTSVLEVLAGPA